MTSGWQTHPSASSGQSNTAAWKRLRTRVLRRDGRECQIRGPRCLGAATAVDHIISVAQGGAELDEDNCQSVCAPCHHDKTAQEAQAGRAHNRRRRRPRQHPSDYLAGPP